LAKSFGNTARSKKSTKKVSVHVGAVLCAQSEKLCDTHGTGIKFFRDGEAKSTFESFVDIDELKSWAKNAIATPEDPEALKQKLASLQEEKKAAAAREDFKEAKRLKGVIKLLEERINGKVPDNVQDLLRDKDSRKTMSDAMKGFSKKQLMEAMNDPDVLDILPPALKNLVNHQHVKDSMNNEDYMKQIFASMENEEDMGKILNVMSDPEKMKGMSEELDIPVPEL
jgi:ATP-dependent Clp protease ATP-binding subunit ClpA